MIGTSDAATAVPVAIADNDESASGRLYGRALLLARAAWVGVAILVVAYVIAAIPTKYAALLNSRGGGLTPGMFATYEISIFGVAVALFEAVAALLVWHRSGARMALISAFALVTFPVYADPQQAVAPVAPLWHWTGSGLALTGIIALTLLVYLVPDGRFVPVWTRWIVAPWLVIEAGRQFAPATAWDYTGWPAGLSLLVLAGGLGPALGVMLYRYRKVSTAIQRQQTKWLVWGVLLAVGTVLLASLIVDLLPVTLQRNLLVTATADTVRVCASLLVPLAIAISIGRHRLWALDLLVQRALVYAALTVIVVGLYVLTVGALSTVLSRRGDVLISLAATGLVAFLVQPLRVRLQRAVNRLIYGERDDPYQALSRLTRRLEGSISPDALLPA
ncbi:MAG: hypothetical protein ACRDFX_04315, partial [Chloroflexota bacterium]